MLKIIIADDNKLFMEGLKSILSGNSEINVCGLAHNGNEAYELCRKIKPDIVLMDIVLPICSGIEATKMIKSEFEFVKVIIFTAINNQFSILQCLENGADAYISKNVELKELVSLINSQGKKIIWSQKRAFKSSLNCSENFQEEKDKYKLHLTRREKDILELIMQGKSNKEISSILYLSEGRVRNIISEILYKTGLNDRTQLAVYAITNNLFASA